MLPFNWGNIMIALQDYRDLSEVFVNVDYVGLFLMFARSLTIESKPKRVG